MPSHGYSTYFGMQSHNCWHRTAAFQIQKKKKKKNIIARCLQGSSEMKARYCSIVQALKDERQMILKSCRHCKTAAHTSWNYRARHSRCCQHPCARRALLQHFVAPYWPLKSCRNRTDIARCLQQAGTIPAQRHLPTPQPCDACDFQKMFNSALDCLRSPQDEQLSQLPPCRPRRIARSSQEIEGKSAAVELQKHRRPFVT